MSLLANTGLPKVGSMGFTENYMSDAIPPPSYNFEESTNFEGLQMKIFHPFTPGNAPKLVVTNPDMEVLKDAGKPKETSALIDTRKNFKADLSLSTLKSLDVPRFVSMFHMTRNSLLALVEL